jgi:RNA polymerase sigma-70 factor (ECF subfamily)
MGYLGRAIDDPVGATGFETDWVTVHAAGRLTSQADEALERLCHTYWYPRYIYIRRKGHPPSDAEDLTQAFFSHLLDGSRLGDVHPSKGRFRSFLLASLNHFLANSVN